MPEQRQNRSWMHLVLGIAFILLGFTGEFLILHGGLFAGILLLLASPVLCAVTIWGEAEAFLEETPRRPFRANDLWVIVFVLLLAMFFRFYHIGEIGARFHIDEAIKGTWALQLLKDFQYRPFFDEKESLFVYLDAFFLWCLGPRLVAVKITAAFVGVLTTLVIYLLGRKLWNHEIGSIAAALFAVSPWAVCTNRLAERLNLTPLMASAAILSFMWALEKLSVWRMILAGALAALGMLSFPPYRLIPVLLILIYFTHILTRQNFVKNNRRLLAVWALAFFICFATLLKWSPFLFNMHFIQNLGHEHKMAKDWIDIQRNVVHSLSAIPYKALSDMSFAPVGDPIEQPLVAVLVILGFGYALRHFKKPRYFILILWVLASFMIVIKSNVEPRRFNLIMPANALMGAVALSQSLRFFSSRIPKYRHVFHVSVIMLFILTLSLSTYKKIFLKYYPVFDNPTSYYFAQAKFIEDNNAYFHTLTTPIREGAGEYYLYFIKEGLPKTGVTFNPAGDEIRTIIPFTFQPQKDVLYCIQNKNANIKLLPSIKEFYPHALLTEFKDRKDETLFFSCFVPKDEVTAAQGLKASLKSSDGKQKDFIAKDGDLLSPEIAASIKFSSFDAEWTGSALIPESARWSWHFATDGTPRLFVDDDPVILQRIEGGAYPYKGGAFLMPGLHDIRIQLDECTPSSDCRIFLAKDEKQPELISSGMLFTTPAFEGPFKALHTKATRAAFNRSRSFDLKNPSNDETFKADWIETDNEGRFYIGDYEKRRIAIFSHEGIYLKDFDPFKQPKRPMIQRFFYHVPPDGRCFVAEGSTIRIFTSEGAFDREIETTYCEIQDLITDAEDNIFLLLCDYRIIKLNKSGSKEILAFGERSAKPEGFEWGYHLAFDKNNNLCVLDIGDLDIKRFDAEGRYVRKTPHPFHSQFSNLKVDAMGDIFVFTPLEYQNVYIYDDAGVLYINPDLPRPDLLIPLEGRPLAFTCRAGFEGDPSSIEMAISYSEPLDRKVHCYTSNHPLQESP